MRVRETLSKLTLPLLGAVAMTAGAVLYQIARRPAAKAVSTTLSAEGSTDRSVPEPGLRSEQSTDVALQRNEALLRRLREGGL